MKGERMRESRQQVTVAEVERCTPGAVWPPTFAEHAARYRLARELFSGASLILDVASGSGIGAELLARTGTPVVGVELNHRAISAARAAYASDGVKPYFIRGDVTDLPIRSSTVPAATAFEIIEHVPSPDRLLEELQRVLSPGGVLLISSPEATLDRLIIDNPYHISPMTGREFRDRLERHFRIAADYFQTPLSPTDRARIRQKYRRRRIKRTFRLDKPIHLLRRITSRDVEGAMVGKGHFVMDQTFSAIASPNDPYAVNPVSKLSRGDVPYIWIFRCIKEA